MLVIKKPIELKEKSITTTNEEEEYELPLIEIKGSKREIRGQWDK